MKKIVCLIVIALCSSTVLAQLTPAVAANMQYAMEEIKTAFTAKTGIAVKPVYGSSGKLVAQIRNGAPFDLFVSADVAWAESLCVHRQGTGRPKVYAYGAVVLWTMRDVDLSKGLPVLATPAVSKVAIGDLALTVYGPAAKHALEKSGLWSAVEKKCVYGASISQVAQYVVTGAVEIGFAAKSAVLADDMKGKGRWVDVDTSLYGKIPQAAVILQYGVDNNKKDVQNLFDFIYSPESRAILTKYGYVLP